MSSERRAKIERFASALRRLRRDAGHSTARAFYRTQGGQRFFGCGYKAYVNVERGKSAPQPALAEKLVAALRVALDPVRARDFVVAYLEASLGSRELLDFAARSLCAARANPPASAGYAAPLSAAQQRLIHDSPEQYWVFHLLAQDGRARDIDELASLLDFPEASLRAAIDSLSRAGLIGRDGPGRFKAKVVPPKARLAEPVPPNLAKLEKYWDEMENRKGRLILEHPLFLRASEREFSQYFQHLGDSALGAERCADGEHAPDSALFLVQVWVRKLLPF